MIKTARQEERSRQETAVTDLRQRLGLPIYIHTYIHTYILEFLSRLVSVTMAREETEQRCAAHIQEIQVIVTQYTSVCMYVCMYR